MRRRKLSPHSTNPPPEVLQEAIKASIENTKGIFKDDRKFLDSIKKGKTKKTIKYFWKLLEL